ncbi:hypothetical protein D3C86_1893710 [compost metagenome]
MTIFADSQNTQIQPASLGNLLHNPRTLAVIGVVRSERNVVFRRHAEWLENMLLQEHLARRRVFWR